MLAIVVHSGGQTGVDRAALDAALAQGIPVGGWCPRGRRAEDGPIPMRYPLDETPTPDYAERTRWNVRDADATLVLTRGLPMGGTATTVEAANALGKPLRIVDLSATEAVAPVVAWLREHEVTVLNVAGPRASTAPGSYAEAKRFMTKLLRSWGERPSSART